MAKMGRKPVEIDWKKVDLSCSYNMKEVHVAFMAGCSVTALCDHIRKLEDCTFREYREKRMANSAFEVISHIMEAVRNKNITAMIWASKNIAGWRDQP